MKSFRLPDGSTTTERGVYSRAWESLFHPLCEGLGWVVLAYDPGVQFESEGSSLTLTVAQVRAIARLLAKEAEE